MADLSPGGVIAAWWSRFDGAGSLLSRIGGWPGLRTFRSARFRLVVAISLWLIGIALLSVRMIQQVGDPLGQFGIDFADYRTASLRMLDGGSPYAPEMLTGPIDAQGTDRYRYPPPFAQAIAPLAVLPSEVGVWIWFVGDTVLIFGAVWVAAGAAGAPPSRERFVWTGVATTYFLPTFDALLKGNVSILVAFAFALLLATRAPGAEPRARVSAATAGGILGAAITLRVTPVTLLPAALRDDRRTGAWAIASLASIVAVSFALAPHAWVDYGRVLSNLLAGSADYPNNLAPAVVALHLGLDPRSGDLLRLSTLVAALALVGMSVWLARGRDGWPAAVACGVIAGLLLPAAIWYHYLVVLLPLVAFAWVKAKPLTRWGLASAGAAISIGLAWLPLATIGATWLAGTAVYALWPRET